MSEQNTILKKYGYLPYEIDPTLDLVDEIQKMKKEKNAVILAHYYQDADIQDIADYIGDSLGLAQQAAATEADIILFAGVHFMAETAKMLNPRKKVILPDIDSIPEDQQIIFAPDKNLGAYLNKITGRNMVLWDGACMVHEIFSKEKLVKLKERHPSALILAHPECESHILEMADYIASTTGLLNFTKSSKAQTFIVATESGILHQMQKASPEKSFIAAPPNNNCACNECPHMRLNTLEKLYLALKHELPEILLPDETIIKGRVCIDRMLEISAQAGL